jgi:hypothetical protein
VEETFVSALFPYWHQSSCQLSLLSLKAVRMSKSSLPLCFCGYDLLLWHAKFGDIDCSEFFTTFQVDIKSAKIFLAVCLGMKFL